MTNEFPKTIWQTHNHKQEWLPEHLVRIASSWINLNPGWEYRYVDQVQRGETVKKYEKIYEAYKYQTPAIQSDIWRFITLYEHGGCYADMDSVPTMSLDYILQKINKDVEIVTVPRDKKNVGNTHNFLAKPKSVILENVINKMNDWAENPAKNHKLQPWGLYVNSVYSEENSEKVSELFIASHSRDYKDKFLIKNYIISDYGNIISYEDFVKNNGLSMSSFNTQLS